VERDAGRLVPGVVLLATAVALLLALLNQWVALGRPYNYRNSTVSADYSTMARSFVEYGVLRLGGVPIINNPPLGLKPNAYAHWPPLFPIILSFLFRIFGESERVAHGLMLAIFLVNAALAYALVRLSLGKLAGLIALFGWLVLPVSALYAHLIVNLHLGYTFLLVALVAFPKATGAERLERGWAALGCLAVAIAAASSWEPLLALPALLAACLWCRRGSETTLALLYAATGVVAVIAILGNYVYQYPYLLADLWRVIKFRSGFGEQFAVDLYASRVGQPSLAKVVLVYMGRHSQQLGLAPLAAVAWLVLSGLQGIRERQGSPQAMVFCALLGPWWLWFTLLPNHGFSHDYNMLLAVPAASMALAWVGGGILRKTREPASQARWGLKKFGLLATVLLVMMEPLGSTLYDKVKQGAALNADSSEISLARDVSRATEPGSVVMVSGASGAIVFYSKRHIVRYIDDEQVLEEARKTVPGLFPRARLYLAITPEARSRFVLALKKYKIVRETPNLILLSLTDAR
jgi:hypothetical protein